MEVPREKTGDGGAQREDRMMEMLGSQKKAVEQKENAAVGVCKPRTMVDFLTGKCL